MPASLPNDEKGDEGLQKEKVIFQKSRVGLATRDMRQIDYGAIKCREK